MTCQVLFNRTEVGDEFDSGLVTLAVTVGKSFTNSYYICRGWGWEVHLGVEGNVWLRDTGPCMMLPV